MTFRHIHLALATAALFSGLAQAQAVAPPPLPIGSMQARPEPGMSEPERKRAVRAHHHKAHNKRDYTHDDSVRPQPVSTGGAQAGARGTDMSAPRGAGAPVGGNGTGPAREKTDRGASGWFFGNDKK